MQTFSGVQRFCISSFKLAGKNAICPEGAWLESHSAQFVQVPFPACVPSSSHLVTVYSRHYFLRSRGQVSAFEAGSAGTKRIRPDFLRVFLSKCRADYNGDLNLSGESDRVSEIPESGCDLRLFCGIAKPGPDSLKNGISATVWKSDIGSEFSEILSRDFRPRKLQNPDSRFNYRIADQPSEKIS
jgi:hypothetical protein